jgi:hypothetical protein
MDTVSAHADAIGRQYQYTNIKDMQGQQGKKEPERRQARLMGKRGLRERYRTAVLF